MLSPYEPGNIVAFGEGAFRRVGIVLGEFDHTLFGLALMVRTATNAATGQQFDVVPIAKVKPSNFDELIASAKRERDEIVARVQAFIEREIAA